MTEEYIPAFPKPKDARSCFHCGATFEPAKASSNKRFCTVRCWYAWKNHMSARNRKCQVCGAAYVQPQPGTRIKWCSNPCRSAYQKSRRVASCKKCGNSFEAKQPCQAISQKYCSKRCSELGWVKPAQEFTCVGCGRKCIDRSLGKRRRMYCDKACQTKTMIGTHSPLYRGNRRQDRGANWRAHAKLARSRDGNKCVSCGATSAELASVDHIVPFRLTVVYGQTDGLDPNHIDNLICLCRSHHGKKTQAERKLLEGDLVGFVCAIKSFMPIERVDAALNLWSIGRHSATRLPFEPIPRYLVVKEHADEKPCPAKERTDVSREA